MARATGPYEHAEFVVTTEYEVLEVLREGKAESLFSADRKTIGFKYSRFVGLSETIKNRSPKVVQRAARRELESLRGSFRKVIDREALCLIDPRIENEGPIASTDPEIIRKVRNFFSGFSKSHGRER
jgi:hypothetical protein